MSFDFFGKQIVVFASDLASAIDQNPYKPKEETALGVWKRFDRVSFAFSLALAYSGEVFELTKKYVKDKPLRNPLPSEVDSDHGKQAFTLVLKEIFTNHEWRGLRQKLMQFVDTKGFREAKEKVLLSSLGESQRVNEAIGALCNEENKTVEEKVEEVVKTITKETGKTVDKETQDALVGKLSRDRGTVLEAKTVKDYAIASGKDVRREPARSYRKLMTYEDMSWVLCGRVDAWDEHTIVEVKNRTKRFMCPDYDVLQLQAYMFLCNKSKGILLERLHGKNRETPFEFNKSYWNEAIVPALYEFVRDVEDKVIMSRSILDGVTPSSSPRKRGHDSVVASPVASPIASPVAKMARSPLNKGHQGVVEGASWDNEGSSDIEINCSGQSNDSFVLYLSPDDTESDEELANLPLDDILNSTLTPTKGGIVQN